MTYINKQRFSGWIFYAFIYSFFVTSCHKDVSYHPANTYSNILILGNSITYLPPNQSLGWNGSWGLAASTAEKDYVHILTANFKNQNPSAQVTAMNISGFEYGFNTFNLDSAFLTISKTKPDFVILRIGENVADGFNTTVFDKKYQALINYFTVANPQVKILAVGSFWLGKNNVDVEMQKYSPFISLSYLSKTITNEAWGLYTNAAVEQHPSDKGMNAIAQAMWNKILDVE